MFSTVILSLEGINLRRGYIVKEMSIHFPQDNSFRHYFFRRPQNMTLTPEDKNTCYYATKVLGGLGMNEASNGSLDNPIHISILRSLSHFRILVVGNVAKLYVQAILPTTEVKDLQEISSFRYPSTLPTARCGFEHNPRYCSLAKLKCVKDFATRNPGIME